MANDNTSPRGFRAMSAKKAREIQSLGGQNSPQNFKNNRALASRAGRLGGKKSRRGTTTDR
jgi:general stress protein YciG